MNSKSMNGDPFELRLRLTELRLEHRELDEQIDRLSHEAQHNQLLLQRLKRRRLALKDMIIHLESDLIPDIDA